MNLKVIGRIIGVLTAVCIILCIQYFLPATEKVYLVGTEVKRMDKKHINSKPKTANKDVRFIVARDIETGKTLMFRNEDMPWPPYFKFNSGDLAGKVMNWEEFQEKALVLITYYGWRIPIISLYPNATALKIVDNEYEHVPWFNYFFLSFLVLIIGFFGFKLKTKKPEAPS